MSSLPLDHRAQFGCLCCGTLNLRSKSTRTSPFLTLRAGLSSTFDSLSIPTSFLSCPTCGFIFYDRGLSDSEAQRYYRDYRSEEYFQTRHFFEPFYTRSHHEASSANNITIKPRVHALSQLFHRHHLSIFGPILDYAGDNGLLLSQFLTSLHTPTTSAFVYDLSNQPLSPGIQSWSPTTLTPPRFQCILAMQFLEHVHDPRFTLETLLTLLEPGGILYLEVPYDETFYDASGPDRLRRPILRILDRCRWLQIALDFYSTAFRLYFHCLPPFGYLPMREHLQFFSLSSLRALSDSLSKIPHRILELQRHPNLGSYLLIQKI